MRPRAGRVLLDGAPIAGMRGKEVARRVALLPQSPIAPEAITVGDLVARGRFPHQGLLRQWSPDDARAVAAALEATETVELRERLVSSLSGGQRQRVWLAMALAQETEVLLLDEPTTFLDIAHQFEVLSLCSRLHAEGRTLVAVLHDLNQAARYATHLIAMRDGQWWRRGGRPRSSPPSWSSPCSACLPASSPIRSPRPSWSRPSHRVAVVAPARIVSTRSWRPFPPSRWPHEHHREGCRSARPSPTLSW